MVVKRFGVGLRWLLVPGRSGDLVTSQAMVGYGAYSRDCLSHRRILDRAKPGDGHRILCRVYLKGSYESFC